MPVRRGRRSEGTVGREDPQICPAVKSIGKVGNELRLVVIRYLIDGPLRFNELMATVQTIDPKSLSRVLKYLVSEGIVRREVLGTQPFKVRYSLTEKGMELTPVITSLQAWGQRWLMSPPEPTLAPESVPPPAVRTGASSRALGRATPNRPLKA